MDWASRPASASTRPWKRRALSKRRSATPWLRATLRPLAQPIPELSGLPAVDDAVGGDPGDAGVGDCVVGERKLGDAVRVAVEREDAAFVHRHRGQLVIDVLPAPVAVALDAHSPL